MSKFKLITDMVKSKLFPGPPLSRTATALCLAAGGFLGHCVVFPLVSPGSVVKWRKAAEAEAEANLKAAEAEAEANQVEAIYPMEKNN